MNKRRGRQPGNPEVETPTGNPEVETPTGNPKVATPRWQPRGGNPEVVTPSGNPEKPIDTGDLMRFCPPHTQPPPEEPRPGGGAIGIPRKLSDWPGTAQGEVTL